MESDETIYQSWIDEHREAVFRLAYLILGDADDAEDVAQETFIRAFQALDHYDPSRPARPWLLSIAANLSRNKRRSIGRYWAALRRFARQSPDHNILSAEADNTQQAEARALWRAVQCLRTSEQEIIYLRYFLELSVRETADVLDIQPGTVKSRLHRALKQLRFVIEQDFPLLVEGRTR